MDMNVDETGRHRQSARIDDAMIFARNFSRRVDSTDSPILQQNVSGLWLFTRAIHNRSADNQDGIIAARMRALQFRPPKARNRIARRTATPFFTCSRTSERAPSA